MQIDMEIIRLIIRIITETNLASGHKIKFVKISTENTTEKTLFYLISDTIRSRK